MHLLSARIWRRRCIIGSTTWRRRCMTASTQLGGRLYLPSSNTVWIGNFYFWTVLIWTVLRFLYSRDLLMNPETYIICYLDPYYRSSKETQLRWSLDSFNFLAISSNPMERLRGPTHTVSSLLKLYLERDESLLGNKRVTENRENRMVSKTNNIPIYNGRPYNWEQLYLNGSISDSKLS
jgi:hypothetical protein